MNNDLVEELGVVVWICGVVALAVRRHDLWWCFVLFFVPNFEPNHYYFAQFFQTDQNHGNRPKKTR